MLLFHINGRYDKVVINKMIRENAKKGGGWGGGGMKKRLWVWKL